jgi:hypothetical protein
VSPAYGHVREADQSAADALTTAVLTTTAALATRNAPSSGSGGGSRSGSGGSGGEPHSRASGSGRSPVAHSGLTPLAGSSAALSPQRGLPARTVSSRRFPDMALTGAGGSFMLNAGSGSGGAAAGAPGSVRGAHAVSVTRRLLAAPELALADAASGLPAMGGAVDDEAAQARPAEPLARTVAPAASAGGRSGGALASAASRMMLAPVRETERAHGAQ